MTATPNLERSLRYLLAWAPSVEAARSTLAQRPVADAVLNAGTLSFAANANFGSVTGATNTATGAILAARRYSMARGWIEVPVAALGTGSARRDRALRAALDIDRHPTMQFVLRGATVVSAALGTRDTTTLLVRGRLSIRGVTRHVEVPATLTRTASRTRVTSVFALNLADYGVRPLRRLLGLLRVGRQIEVRVNLWFVDRLAVTDDASAAPHPA